MLDALGDRMKNYENINRVYLTRRMPCILRLDGRAFHTYTKKFNKPFDYVFMEAMWDTAKQLRQNISGAKMAYVQSDEISILLTDYDTLETEPWFGKNLQKMCSVAASMASIFFYKAHDNAIEDYIETCEENDYIIPEETLICIEDLSGDCKYCGPRCDYEPERDYKIKNMYPEAYGKYYDSHGITILVYA